MWRFILLTFAFLGWSFYELSGGADYHPREGSRQAAALKAEAEGKLAALSPAVTASMMDAAFASDTATLARNDADTPAMTTMMPRPQTVETSQHPLFASTGASRPEPLIQPAAESRLANLTLAQPAAFAQAAGYDRDREDAPEQAALTEQATRDLRHITGTSVNMRTGPGTGFGVLARVTRDTEVEVLETFENGWMRLRVLDSNRIGWVSGKLVSQAGG